MVIIEDVSDRVEKEDEQSVVVRRLERNARAIVTNNWRQVICNALAEGVPFAVTL